MLHALTTLNEHHTQLQAEVMQLGGLQQEDAYLRSQGTRGSRVTPLMDKLAKADKLSGHG